MASFTCTNVSESDVPAARKDIWDVITSPDLLAELTPVIDSITTDGDLWTWRLRTLKVLGTSTAPSFTERMHFDESGHELRYEHAPEGRKERAGAEGIYTLKDLDDGGTHLEIHLTLQVELPLPKVSRKAVEGVMAATMSRTGKRFAENLYRHLGIDGTPVTHEHSS